METTKTFGRSVRMLALTVVGVVMLTWGAGSAGAATQAQAPRFVVPANAPSGGTLPQKIATADFNDDGKTDVASANQGPIPLFGSSVGVLLGDGKGGLSGPVTTDLPDGMGSCDLAAGNFDGTGGTDLMVVSCTTGGYGGIESLTADGDGSFTVKQQIANTAEGQLASADFNGDGTDDVAFSQNGTAQVRIYIGKGDGTFKAPVTKSTGFDSYDLMTGDVNGDHMADLVGAAGGPIWTMLNDGTGKFGAQIYTFSADLSGIELALGQFDADGNLDVATVDASGGHVFVGLGQGNGHFTAGTPIGPIGPQPNWVEAADMTGDGITDLIADVDSNSAVVLVGDGTGSFLKRSYWVTGSEGLTAADLNGVGPDDLVTFSSDPGVIHATIATNKSLKAGRLVHGAYPHVAADLDNDGTLDKVTGSTDVVKPGVIRSQIVAQINKGAGTFGKQMVSKVRIETAASGIGAIEVADINEDGFLDVVGGFTNFQPSPNNLFWMIGTGNGAFGAPTLSTTGDINADVVSLGVADVNADGHVDIVTHTLSQLSTRLGKGNGRFAQPILSGFSGPSQEATMVADFTGDGVPDTVTVRRTGNEDFGSGDIYLQQGHGNGTFTRILTRSVDSNLGQADMTDLDGDGRPDVVTIGSAGFDGGKNAIWVLITTDQGALGVPVAYSGPASGLGVADYNGDGAPDIAVNAINAIQIYANAGNGTFPTISSILSAGAVALGADFTGDGAADIAGTSGVWGDYFALYVNAG